MTIDQLVERLGDIQAARSAEENRATTEEEWRSLGCPEATHEARVSQELFDRLPLEHRNADGTRGYCCGFAVCVVDGMDERQLFWAKPDGEVVGALVIEEERS